MSNFAKAIRDFFNIEIDIDKLPWPPIPDRPVGITLTGRKTMTKQEITDKINRLYDEIWKIEREIERLDDLLEEIGDTEELNDH